MKNSVVVTGMGLVYPIWDNIQDFWKNLESGKNGIDQITHFDTDKFDVKIAGQSQIQLDNYFDRKELNKLDRFSTFAIIAADQAINQSKIINDNISKERIGVIVGSGIVLLCCWLVCVFFFFFQAEDGIRDSP